MTKLHKVLTGVSFNGRVKGMICKVVNYDDVSGLYIYINNLGNYGYSTKDYIIKNQI